MTEVTREQIVAEARTWIGTPYRLGARAKGAGCDCGTFLGEVMIALGLADASLYEGLNVKHHDWWQNTSAEIYRRRMMRHAVKVLASVCYRSLEVLPGCLVLMRTAGAKISNHGAVVAAWPWIIHCNYSGVQEVDVSRDPMWIMRPVEVFDPLKKVERIIG